MDNLLELSQKIISKAKEKNLKIAVAESCTGGLLASCLTDIPGSSDVFQGGIVAYQDKNKIAVLKVDEKVIDKHSAYHPFTAKAMAESALKLFEADYALATTGHTGDGSEFPGKVDIGLAHKEGNTELIAFEQTATRLELKKAFCREALELLWNAIH